jgi:hypothetical protein
VLGAVLPSLLAASDASDAQVGGRQGDHDDDGRMADLDAVDDRRGGYAGRPHLQQRL